MSAPTDGKIEVANRPWAEAAAFAVSAFLLFFWFLRPLGEYDVFYYLALGDWIREHHQLVPYPSFLNTADRFPAVWDPNPEWATGVLTSLLYGIDGAETMSRAIAVTLTLMFSLSYLAARLAGAPAWAAWTATALAVPCFESRVMWRSGLITDVFLVGLFTFYLAGYRFGWRSRPKRFAFLFLYGALWTQFHQGFLSGLIMMFFWFLAHLIDARQEHRVAVIKAGVSEGVVFALGTMARPTLWGSYLFILEHMTRPLPMQLVLEWEPLRLGGLKGPFAVYCALSVLALGILLVTAWKVRRSGQVLPLVAGLLVLVYGYLMVRYIRALGEFVPLSIPCLALAAQLAYLGLGQPRLKLLQRLAPLGMAMAGIALFLWSHGPDLGSREVRRQRFLQDYPVDNLALLKSGKGLGKGRLFNSYHFGGFLAGYGVPPFVHGWTPLFPDSILVDYLDIIRSPERSATLVDEYGIDKLLLAYPKAHDPASVRFLKRLYEEPGWELFSFDDATLLFRREGSQGGDDQPALLGLRPGAEQPLGAAANIDPKIFELARERAPNSPIVLAMASDWYHQKNDLDGALRWADDGIARFPQSSVFYQRKTEYLLQRSDVKGAVATAEQGWRASHGNKDQLAVSLARAYIALWSSGQVADFDGQRGAAIDALAGVGQPTRSSVGLLQTLRQLEAP